MRVAEQIRTKLTEALAPTRLDIVDESHRHAGHPGHNLEGESHFHVTVVSAAFSGKSRMERHRLVNTLLAAELAGRIHALSLNTRAPEEFTAEQGAAT